MSVRSKYYPIKCMPTVFPDGSFNAENDAFKLHKALENDTIDESQIIEVLGKRTFEQRMKIAIAYHDDSETLYKCLESKLGGKFRLTVLALMVEPSKFYASELHNNLYGELDVDFLITILATHSNYAIKLLTENYEKMYGCKIIDNLTISDVDAREFFTLLLQGCRIETEIIMKCVETDIVVLNAYYTTDKNKWKKFVLQVLGTRSYQHLLEMDTFEALHELTSEFTIETQYMFRAFIKYVTDKNYWFAVGFYNSFPVNHDSISCIDDQHIIRIFVGRCELDFGDIKRVFEAARYGKMEEYVKILPEVAYKNLLNTIIS